MKFNYLASLLFVGIACTSSQAIEVQVEGKKVEVPFCGGIAGIKCSPKEWCDFPKEHVCGIADYPGKCLPRPEKCIKIYLPVCGCDGQTYGNWCQANAGGTDVAYNGPCLTKH